MTVTPTAVQLSNATTQVTWATTDADPAAGWEILRKDDAAAPVTIGTLEAGASRTFFDGLPAAAGVVVIYTVQDLTTTTTGDSQALTMVDMDAPFTFGQLDALHTEPRYTSLADVYQVLGNGLATGQDVERDARLTEAVVSCEWAIDAELGRSFPDTGTNPKVLGVPLSVKSVARASAISIYKSSEAPFGAAGSDDFLGSVSVAQIVSENVRRNPQLMQFKVSWGAR